MAKGDGGKGVGSRPKDDGQPEDALYQIPLSEFTAARNALVTKLKRGGKAADASRVKGLVKPSIPAWAVNQLFWHHRTQFDSLLAVGARFRQAQAAQLQGRTADLRGPLEERREALSALSRIAAATLTGAGHNASQDTMRRITSTLEAMSVLAGTDAAPQAGRLIDEVEPPGFEALAALVPRIAGDGHAAGGPSKVLTFRQQQKRQQKRVPNSAEQQKALLVAARAAVQEAEQALRASRRDAERAEEALKKAATSAKDADRARGDAEKQLEKASADADQARQQARKTAAAAEEAAQGVADAERALEKAKQELAELTAKA